MKNIYYITRTIPGGGSGGALIRQGTVKYLRESGFKVVVVALSDRNQELEDMILIKGVSSRFFIRMNMVLYNLGIYNDYLETWANKAFRSLKDRVKKDDVVLATSGGELGTLMLAQKLKNSIDCRIVYNLHDPIDFTTIDGEFSFLGSVKMRARDKAEKRVFESADAIVTSSQYYADTLKRKYPELNSVITCHHFGYIEKYSRTDEDYRSKTEGKVNVVYGGNMGPLQGPEILIKVANHFPEVKFTFVGDLVYKGGDMPANVEVRKKMPYKEYIDYLSKHASIGFFSLVGNVSKLCVPSKLYEYINVGIPILAAIGGDSRAIVNDKGYGIATDYSVVKLQEALKTLLEPRALEKARTAVINDRDKWYMKNTINELIQSL